MSKARIEIVVAVVSYVTIFLVYLLLIPGLDDSLSNLVYRGLIYAIAAFVLPIMLFGWRDYAKQYGYRREGLAKSAVVGAVLAIPLFALGYSAAAGPVPPLLSWYLMNVLEETYFRGLWQRVGEHLAGPWGAILIPSVLFGIYHLTAGFTPVQIVGPMLFGILASWLRRSTDNILAPILMHMALVTGMTFAPR